MPVLYMLCFLEPSGFRAYGSKAALRVSGVWAYGRKKASQSGMKSLDGM